MQSLDDFPAVGKVADVASLLSCGRNRIYELIATGRLRALKLGSRSLRVTKSAVADFLEHDA